MPTDPIVEEIRKRRDSYAQRFGYDLKAICKDLRRQQAERKLSDRPRVVPNENKKHA